MVYVAYNVLTTVLLSRKEYKTQAAAKAAITRAAALGRFRAVPQMFAVAEKGDFHANIEKREERTNLMTGKKFWARVNDNPACDPSSETYWSS